MAPRLRGIFNLYNAFKRKYRIHFLIAYFKIN